MERIKTNIIELSKLNTRPPESWLKKFKDGKLDVFEFFKEHGEEYEWLYENSDYDLIGWEIENEVFDWDKYSWVVAKYCPENFDAERYNWKKDSWMVAMYCPKKLDPERYNWGTSSFAVATYCPEKLDPERYNWELDGYAVAKYCPDKLDPEKYNWERFSDYVIEYCPEKLSLMPEKYKKGVEQI